MNRGFFGPRIFYDNDGGGNEGGAPAPTPAPAPQQSTPPEWMAGFQSLIDRLGSERATAEKLYQENHREREEARALKAERDDLRKRLPPDGAVVVSADDGAALSAYAALGKPDEIKAAIDELTTMRRDRVLGAVAEVSGYEPAVLRDLDRLAGHLTYEVREVADKGLKVRRAFVCVKGADDAETWTPLSEYAEATWTAHMPALKKGAQRPGIGNAQLRERPAAPAETATPKRKPFTF